MPGYYGYTEGTRTSDKSRTVALVLCLVGGFVGWHYLYVGRFWRAMFCVLTLNLFGLGYIVDIYRITRYKFKDDKKLNLTK